MSTGTSPKSGSDKYVWAGLSTDNKPESAFYGQLALETDTGSAYEWLGSWKQVALNGLLNIHDSCAHNTPVSEYFHRHTGTATTLSSAVTAGDTSISVVDGSSFSNGDFIQIEGIAVESTHPKILSGGGTNTLSLDRPIDNSYIIGDNVEVIVINMAVVGSLGSPISYKFIPDQLEVWHLIRILISMVHTAAADDSKFGDLATLTNGCLLRIYNGTTGLYRTVANWKSNSDLKLDMYDVDYTDKAGAGKYGTNCRWSIKKGTEAAPHLDGSAGDYVELLIQDDLSLLSSFYIKGQSHIENE